MLAVSSSISTLQNQIDTVLGRMDAEREIKTFHSRIVPGFYSVMQSGAV